MDAQTYEYSQFTKGSSRLFEKQKRCQGCNKGFAQRRAFAFKTYQLWTGSIIKHKKEEGDRKVYRIKLIWKNQIEIRKK